MKKYLITTTFVVVVAAIAAPAFAQPRITTYDSLRTYFRVEPCCASTLANCLRQKPTCAIASRLFGFLKWADSTGAPPDRMVEATNEHYISLVGKNSVTIDNEWWPVVGDKSAPVTVTMYFAGTCPTCKSNYRDLSREVTNGRLKGKVKIVSKPYSRPYDNPVNIALAAAHEMGRFPDVMLALAEHKGRVDEGTIFGIAASKMMDTLRLRTLVNDQAIKNRVKASFDEGDKHGVEVVPTYFINGRKYHSRLEVRWIADVIEHAHENWK